MAKSKTTDWLKLAREYLAANAAESGADEIIAGLCDEVEELRDELRALNQGVAHNSAIDRAEIEHWKEIARERR